MWGDPQISRIFPHSPNPALGSRREGFRIRFEGGTPFSQQLNPPLSLGGVYVGRLTGVEAAFEELREGIEVFPFLFGYHIIFSSLEEDVMSRVSYIAFASSGEHVMGRFAPADFSSGN